MQTAALALCCLAPTRLSSEEFDYATLKGKAKSLSQQGYVARQPVDIPEIQALDYDHYQHIDFQDENALWAGEKTNFRIQFFHLGLYFQKPVKINEVVDGDAKPINFDPDQFYYGRSGVDGDKLPKDLGYAGFRINFKEDWDRDVSAFLGASYFRAVGFDWQYGLSARGLGLDTGMPTGEEFPDFTEFWLERPEKGSDTLVIYALLDSPSATGAYRIVMTPGKTLVMDVNATIYPREDLENAGIAPLTSMFQYGENDRRKHVSDDWRPEIHDTDGLSVLTGSGEWIWRPLVNPPHPRLNSYLDESPRGFGLLQRDRNFDHYQDDAVYYERRPSLWVEPTEPWGPGEVKLFELPTVDETFDNIVAFWHPQDPLRAGEEYRYDYRLYWGTKEVLQPSNSRVVATRTGKGGNIGQKQDYFSRRFVLDFEGPALESLGNDTPLKAVVTSDRGKIENAYARWMPDGETVRAMFDLAPDESTEPINVRLYLRTEAEEQPLSETWIYQYTPPPVSERSW
ncbi:glucan biosynthesis protein [Pelagicoccus albus]|nr:glucan biosynthesis protein D [Pelagicoccus albus]